MAMTRVLMKTLLGDMTLELDADKAQPPLLILSSMLKAGTTTAPSSIE